MLIAEEITCKYDYIPEIKSFMKYLRLDKSPHTIDSYRQAIETLFEFLNIENFDQIKNVNTGQIDDYRVFLKESGNQHSTINTRQKALKAFYNWLEDRKYILKDSNPLGAIKGLKVDQTEQETFSPEEIIALFNSTKNTELKLMFHFLFDTGIRKAELMYLKLSDFYIDDEKDVYVRFLGKGHKWRNLYLFDDAKRLYFDYLEIRKEKTGADSEYFFVSNRKNNDGIYGPYSEKTLLNRLKTQMKKAGFDEKRIAQLHVHSTRHTYLTGCSENGIDPSLTQKIAGHSNYGITMKYYNHPSQKALKKAMRSRVKELSYENTKIS